MASLSFPRGRHAQGLESQGFDPWLTGRSFSMLVPMCRVGLAVVLTMLLVVDPLLFHAGVWGHDAQHRALVLWLGGRRSFGMGIPLRGSLSVGSRRCASSG